MVQKRTSFVILFLIGIMICVLAACNPVDSAALSEDLTKRYQSAAKPTETKTLSQEATQTIVTPINPRSTQTATLQPTSRAGIEIANLQGTTVNFWYPWGGPTNQALQDLIEKFNQQNEWGIIVKGSSFNSLENLADEINLAALEGETPELVQAYLYQALDWNIEKPLVLNEFINDPQVGIAQNEQADFLPAFWSTNKVSGDYLGIPAFGFGQLLYYNQTWAQELGFQEAPQTPEQFREQACRAAQANKEDERPDNDSTGGLILSTHYSPVLSWIAGFGGSIFNEENSGSKQGPYRFNTPEVKQTLNFLRELYDNGCAWLPDEPYPEEEFSDRQGLFAMGSISNLPYQYQVFSRSGNTDRWTVIPFPSPSNQPAIDVYSPSYMIFSSEPKQSLASWLFIKWMLLPENQARLAAAASAFPVRQAAIEELQAQSQIPQWIAALPLLSNSIPEPNIRSWNLVRWAVSDASTQLFRSYFTIDQVPELAAFLDKTVTELHANTPKDK